MSRQKMFSVPFFLIFFLAVLSFTSYGTETDAQSVVTGIGAGLEDFNIEEIQKFIDAQSGQTGWNLSFSELAKDLLSGNLKTVMQKMGTAVKDYLFKELENSTVLMGQVIALGIIGAVFSNFSGIFTSSQISESGFFVTYLLLFTCLATSFFASIQIAGQAVNQVLQFMQVLMPSFFLAAAFAGGSVSSVAVYEFTLWAITMAQWLMMDVMIPFVRVYMLLVLAGHVTKEDILSKLTDLLKNVIDWSLKTLLGLFLGFHMIQGMILPYVDSMKSATVQKLIGIIPGLGQGAGAITQIVMGSGVLIKNSIGAAGVVVLLIMMLIPVLKLVVMMLMYQGVAAILQPVCDKRIVSCISKTAQGHKMLLNIVLSSALLFIITIAVVCSWKSFTAG
ncbi:sporulation protein [Clostridium sp. chh4-2]|uniref:stage III sporulation protein AE n=1 Tax=Clostridium sp. chh4-2 TaxID=2067550 RepID=UPI000CCDDC44|nr:stage III sporulation protein AE [Clostridium sp. chh4-2]PNV61216.1 sporulation protein [Clostridium sp. chh4-2]